MIVKLFLFLTLFYTISIVGYGRLLGKNLFSSSSSSSSSTTSIPTILPKNSTIYNFKPTQRWRYTTTEANDLFNLWKKQEKQRRNPYTFEPISFSFSSTSSSLLSSSIPPSISSTISNSKNKMNTILKSTQKFLFPRYYNSSNFSISSSSSSSTSSKTNSLKSSLVSSLSSSLPKTPLSLSSTLSSSFFSSSNLFNKQTSFLHRNLPVLIDRINEYFFPSSLPLPFFLSLSFSSFFPLKLPLKKIYNYSLTLSMMKLLSDSFYFYTNFNDKNSFSIIPSNNNNSTSLSSTSPIKYVRFPTLTSFWYPIRPSRSSYAVLSGSLTSLQQELSVRLLLTGYNLVLVTDHPKVELFVKDLNDLQKKLPRENINEKSSTLKYDKTNIENEKKGNELEIIESSSFQPHSLFRDVKIIHTNFSNTLAANHVYENLKKLKVLNKIDILVCNTPSISSSKSFYSIPTSHFTRSSAPSLFSSILPTPISSLISTTPNNDHYCLDELSKSRQYLQESIGFTVSLLDKLIPHVVNRARAPRTLTTPSTPPLMQPSNTTPSSTSISSSISSLTSLKEQDIESFNEMNLMNLWNKNKQALTGGGRIMLISPCNEDISCSNLVRLSPTSSYLKSLAKCLRQELLPHGVLVSYSKPSITSQFTKDYGESERLRSIKDETDENLEIEYEQPLQSPLLLKNTLFNNNEEFFSSITSSSSSSSSSSTKKDINDQNLEPLITSIPFLSPSLTQTSYAIYRGILTGKSEVSVGLQSFLHNNFLKPTLSSPVLSSISKFLFTPVTPPSVILKRFIQQNSIPYYSSENEENENDIDTLDSN